VFGLKPSFKRVPTGGADNFTGLSNTGPITRSVADAALMLTVMTRSYDGDWQALPPENCDYGDDLQGGIAGLRIAFSPDLGVANVSAEVADHVRRAVMVLADLGAEIEEVAVPPPLASYVESEIHAIQWMVALAHTVRALPPEKRSLIDPDVVALARLGEEVPTAVFVEALAARQRLGNGMHHFLRHYDLLVAPTLQTTAPGVPGLPPELQQGSPMTSWCNQTMQPAASIPCGLTSEGLPVGLQIVGRRYADALVLKACQAFETARGPFPMPHLAGVA
jgi:aspartyl-tRNA(Asn)/glutamyl-tRNA(Gln) amidotransferase subunit A